eukprot:GHVN01059063.1.p1 GENE.GHVN01059063.1~~GHVN01059063.1.p1  ORF type:complete len:482 (+),score=33.27 GHVN01059063.1:176-1621(+)
MNVKTKNIIHVFYVLMRGGLLAKAVGESFLDKETSGEDKSLAKKEHEIAGFYGGKESLTISKNTHLLHGWGGALWNFLEKSYEYITEKHKKKEMRNIDQILNEAGFHKDGFKQIVKKILSKDKNVYLKKYKMKAASINLINLEFQKEKPGVFTELVLTSTDRMAKFLEGNEAGKKNFLASLSLGDEKIRVTKKLVLDCSTLEFVSYVNSTMKTFIVKSIGSGKGFLPECAPSFNFRVTKELILERGSGAFISKINKGKFHGFERIVVEWSPDEKYTQKGIEEAGVSIEGNENLDISLEGAFFWLLSTGKCFGFTAKTKYALFKCKTLKLDKIEPKHESLIIEIMKKKRMALYLRPRKELFIGNISIPLLSKKPDNGEMGVFLFKNLNLKKLTLTHYDVLYPINKTLIWSVETLEVRGAQTENLLIANTNISDFEVEFFRVFDAHGVLTTNHLTIGPLVSIRRWAEWCSEGASFCYRFLGGL